VPLASASSNSRHSQNTLNTSHTHNRPQVAQPLNHLQDRNVYVDELKQPSQKTKSIPAQRSSEAGDIVLAVAEERSHFEQPDGHRNYDQQHRQQQLMSEYPEAKVGQHGYKDPITGVVIRQPNDMGESGHAQLRPHPEKISAQMMAGNAALGQMDGSDGGKGITERLSADYHHKKSLNLNDSSNIHVEDSLREAVVPQNSKGSLANSVNYGIGRPSGSSKSQLGRGQRMATAGKP
jgi:hypothetical protein